MTSTINHKVFSKVTPESAYWAGFLAADGNLRISSSGCHQIRVYLAAVDVEHLRKFKEFLKSSNKVSLSPTYPRCSLEVTSPTCYKDLEDIYLLSANKSLTLKFPSLPEEVYSHFIRGYFDGDGTICESFSNRNSVTASLTIGVTCSPFFMDGYYSVVSSALSWESCPKVRNHPNAINKVWYFKDAKAKEFLNWMYRGSTENTRLDRKFEMYERIVVNKVRMRREKLRDDGIVQPH